jgi:non-ribosomal peptide synthetase component F
MTIDDVTVASMRTLASAHATTVFALLTAAVGGVLHRLTGMEALVVGTQLSRRQHPSLQRQVGLLIDSLPLSLDVLPGDQSDALLRRVTRSVRDALTHGSIGFDRLLDLLDVPVISGHTPLFDVVVQYIATNDGREPATHVASGLVVHTVDNDSPLASYLFSVEGSDGPGGTMILQLTADAVVSAEFVALFMARLPDVMAWLLAGNDSPLSSLPIAAAPRPTRSRIALDLS